MFHISLSLSLLALAAGVFLLLKVKAENISGLARWVAWIIIVFSSLMMVMDIVHASIGMCHGGMRGCHGMEQCGPAMCGGGSCGPMEQGHGGMMDKDACGDKHEGHHAAADSAH